MANQAPLKIWIFWHLLRKWKLFHSVLAHMGINYLDKKFRFFTDLLMQKQCDNDAAHYACQNAKQKVRRKTEKRLLARPVHFRRI